MKNGLFSIAIFISAIIMSGSAFADVKIKSKQTMSGQSYENNKTDCAAAIAKVYKVKAKSNGDDIISQIIEQASKEIVRVLGR